MCGVCVSVQVCPAFSVLLPHNCLRNCTAPLLESSSSSSLYSLLSSEWTHVRRLRDFPVSGMGA